ncbi:MAG: hypothetical protein ACREEA_07835 [Stellaceae bacterium]
MSRLAAELPRCMAEILAVDAEEGGGYYRRGAGSRQIRARSWLCSVTQWLNDCGIRSQADTELVRLVR